MPRRIFGGSELALACATAAALMFLFSGCGITSGLDTGEEPGPTCGNSVIEDGEQCDRGNLSGASCNSLGEGEGRLLCDSTCMFDFDMCNRSAPGGYGYGGTGGGVLVQAGSGGALE